jgi:hypothetical protein
MTSGIHWVEQSDLIASTSAVKHKTKQLISYMYENKDMMLDCCVVDESSKVIISGNQRYYMFIELGISVIPVVFVNFIHDVSFQIASKNPLLTKTRFIEVTKDITTKRMTHKSFNITKCKMKPSATVPYVAVKMIMDMNVNTHVETNHECEKLFDCRIEENRWNQRNAYNMPRDYVAGCVRRSSSTACLDTTSASGPLVFAGISANVGHYLNVNHLAHTLVTASSLHAETILLALMTSLYPHSKEIINVITCVDNDMLRLRVMSNQQENGCPIIEELKVTPLCFDELHMTTGKPLDHTRDLKMLVNDTNEPIIIHAVACGKTGLREPHLEWMVAQSASAIAVVDASQFRCSKDEIEAWLSAGAFVIVGADKFMGSAPHAAALLVPNDVISNIDDPLERVMMNNEAFRKMMIPSVNTNYRWTQAIYNMRVFHDIPEGIVLAQTISWGEQLRILFRFPEFKKVLRLRATHDTIAMFTVINPFTRRELSFSQLHAVQRALATSGFDIGLRKRPVFLSPPVQWTKNKAVLTLTLGVADYIHHVGGFDLVEDDQSALTNVVRVVNELFYQSPKHTHIN